MWTQDDIQGGNHGSRNQAIHSYIGAKVLRDGEPVFWALVRVKKTGETFWAWETPGKAKFMKIELEANGMEIIEEKTI